MNNVTSKSEFMAPPPHRLHPHFSKAPEAVLYQTQRSEFFTNKINDEFSEDVEQSIFRLPSYTYNWDMDILHINENAWKKAIHSGVRPSQVFAHPLTIKAVDGAMAYYRSVAMISRHSMGNAKRSVDKYEKLGKTPDDQTLIAFCAHYNSIISMNILNAEIVSPEVVRMWRLTMLGAQLQGDYNNHRGKQLETHLKKKICSHLTEKGLLDEFDEGKNSFYLKSGTLLKFRRDPDIMVYKPSGELKTVVELKSGKERSNVSSRIGEGIKTLSRMIRKCPSVKTALVLTEHSMTEKAKIDLAHNQAIIHQHYFVEQLNGDSVYFAGFVGLLVG